MASGRLSQDSGNPEHPETQQVPQKTKDDGRIIFNCPFTNDDRDDWRSRSNAPRTDSNWPHKEELRKQFDVINGEVLSYDVVYRGKDLDLNLDSSDWMNSLCGQLATLLQLKIEDPMRGKWDDVYDETSRYDQEDRTLSRRYVFYEYHCEMYSDAPKNKTIPPVQKNEKEYYLHKIGICIAKRPEKYTSDEKPKDLYSCASEVFRQREKKENKGKIAGKEQVGQDCGNLVLVFCRQEAEGINIRKSIALNFHVTGYRIPAGMNQNPKEKAKEIAKHAGKMVSFFQNPIPPNTEATRAIDALFESEELDHPIHDNEEIFKPVGKSKQKVAYYKSKRNVASTSEQEPEEEQVLLQTPQSAAPLMNPPDYQQPQHQQGYSNPNPMPYSQQPTSPMNYSYQPQYQQRHPNFNPMMQPQDQSVEMKLPYNRSCHRQAQPFSTQSYYNQLSLFGGYNNPPQMPQAQFLQWQPWQVESRLNDLSHLWRWASRDLQEEQKLYGTLLSRQPSKQNEELMGAIQTSQYRQWYINLAIVQITQEFTELHTMLNEMLSPPTADNHRTRPSYQPRK